MQAVTPIAASYHISAGTLVIGQIEISSGLDDFVRTKVGDAVAFVVGTCSRCLRLEALGSSMGK